MDQGRGRDKEQGEGGGDSQEAVIEGGYRAEGRGERGAQDKALGSGQGREMVGLP